MEHTAPPSNLRNENRQEEPGRGGSLQNADRSGGRAAGSGGDLEVSGGWRRLLRRAGDRKDFPVLITLPAVVLAAAFALAVILVILALAFSFCLPDQA